MSVIDMNIEEIGTSFTPISMSQIMTAASRWDFVSPMSLGQPVYIEAMGPLGLECSLPSTIIKTDFRSFAGCIPEDDLEMMIKAIEEGCEQVDSDGW